MNYKEAMEYMEETARYGSVPGLTVTKELLGRLGNPEKDLKIVHIAGTNGKGSTISYLSAIMQEAGYKTGRFISPTLISYRERIQIDDCNISEEDFCSLLTTICHAIAKMQEDGYPHATAFEIDTCMAFLYFKKYNCDLILLETGMGGLEDATNVVENTLVSVITSVSMDHMAYLGSSLREIALNKAGIIKKGAFVVSIEQEPEVMEVIKSVCMDKKCPLSVAKPSEIFDIKGDYTQQIFSYAGLLKIIRDIQITLPGTFQMDNAILAIHVIEALNKTGFTVREEQLRRGLKNTVWLGRFSCICQNPLFVIDGAHNEDAARRFAESVKQYFTNRDIIYIMGVLKDKEYDKIAARTAGLARDIITVATPENERALPAYELAETVRKYNSRVTAADSLQEAVEMSFLLAGEDSVIIAFGSLSYLGELIHIVENKDKMRSDLHGRQR